MKILSIILVMFLLQASSCNQEEPVIKNGEGVITSKFATELATVTDDFSKKAVLGVGNHVTYKRGAVLPGMKNGQRVLKMIDIDGGGELWEWNDPINDRKYDALDYYIYQNYFVFDEGRELYIIDLETGNTVWKKRYDMGEVPFFWTQDGIDEIFYISASYSPYLPNETSFVKIYESSLAIETELIGLIEIKSENTNHFPGKMGVFKSEIGDTLIYFDSHDSSPFVGFINLYNVTKKEWIYSKKETNLPSNGAAKPKLHNGIVYNAIGYFIVATDLMSGEVVWKREFNNAGYGTSGFILVPEKNLIIFNAESSSTTLYALDLTTGSTVWSEPSSGTSSHLQYLNGVVYFVGGGDGWLHAVDVDTGKHLWKIVSPDEAINSNAWFARYCAVFPGKNGEKGKVVVSSGLHAFAYEAER